MRIIRHSSNLPNAIHLAKARNDFIVKGPTLITMDHCRYPKHTKPFLHKELGHGKRLLVASYKHMTILREGFSENKNVLFNPLVTLPFVKSIQSSFKGWCATRLP